MIRALSSVFYTLLPVPEVSTDHHLHTLTEAEIRALHRRERLAIFLRGRPWPLAEDNRSKGCGY